MTGTTRSRPDPAGGSGPRSGIRNGLACCGPGLAGCGRGLAFGGLAIAGAGLILVLMLPVVLVGIGLGILVSPGPGSDVLLAPALLVAAPVLGRLLLPATLLAVRRLAALTRRLSGEWCAIPIASSYRPPPEGDGKTGFRPLLGWLLRDPASWRDLRWLAVNAVVGWIMAVGSAAVVAIGVIWALKDTATRPVPIAPPAFAGNSPVLLFLLGAGCVGLGLWAAPWLLRGYGILARSMLAPTGQAELALRVAHLAQTRADTIDTGAAEMRRIERDLHDGAQARLVAMGMTLDAADQLLEDNPAAARALLAEARESSAQALVELRNLVRGIHPPVLADRGLAEAVRALALDLPQRAQFACELTGRPPAPVESAAYFAVSELLANVSKHAQARQAWIDLRHEGGMLRIGVSDDGIGGADPGRGTGLVGIERLLAAFDGVLAVSSPPGGPTVVNMEIPCALSSPKTFSC